MKKDMPYLIKPSFITELLRSAFKNWRRANNFTLREVEKQTGISNAFLSQFETGKAKNISVQTAETLALLVLGNHNGITGKKEE